MEKTMAEWAEESLKKDFMGDGNLRPKVILIAGDIYLHFDYVAGKEEGSLEKMRDTITRMILIHRLAGTFESCCFMGEAWTSTVPIGAQRKYATCEEDPDRKEMAFFVAFEKDGKKTFKAWQILRADKNVMMKEWIGIQPDTFETWIDKGFQDISDSPPHIVQAAKFMVANLKNGKI